MNMYKFLQKYELKKSFSRRSSHVKFKVSTMQNDSKIVSYQEGICNAM